MCWSYMASVLVLCSLNDSVLCGAIILALVTFQNQISLHQKVISCIEDESELRDIKWIMVEIQFIHQDKCRYS